MVLPPVYPRAITSAARSSVSASRLIAAKLEELDFFKRGLSGGVLVRDKKSGIALFCLSCATLLPLVVQACVLKSRARVPWKVALLHLPVCYITLWVYALGVLSRLFRKPQMADRSSWQK